MAQQNSLYTFVNKLGNVRGMKYKNLEPTFVGLLGGPTRDQVLNDANFVRTRENMSEFGGSSHAARTYRIGVSPLKAFQMSYLSGFLNSKVIQICQLGAGARGERAILFTVNQPIMEFTDLNQAQTFNSISGVIYTMSSNVARNQATLSLPSFIPSNLLNAPVGATHYQFILNATAVSDYAFTAGIGYQPTNAVANGANFTAMGAIIALNVTSASASIVAPIGGAPAMTNATMFTTIGIQFYQQVNAVFYLLAENNAAQIDLLF